MKKILLVLLMIGGLAVTAEAKKPISFAIRSGNVGFFYSSLAPYGEWIQINGGYVWRPLHVSHGWRPYMYGRWAWTDYGWYWISNEPFGWATCHYGRWYYDDYYGWIWIPDDTWGPAWVEWRYNDDYIGWAPLSPYAEFSVGVGITVRNHWMSPAHYWNFVPSRYMTSNRVGDYVQPLDRSQRIFGETRGSVDIAVDNHRVMNRGIDVHMVEQRTNSRIDRTDVTVRTTGGGERIVRGRDQLHIEAFQPKLERTPRHEAVQPQQFRRDERPAAPAFRPRPAPQMRAPMHTQPQRHPVQVQHQRPSRPPQPNTRGRDEGNKRDPYHR